MVICGIILDSLAEIMKVMNHTGLWDADLAWHFEYYHWIYLCGLEFSLGIHSFRLAWLLRFLPPEQNFLNHLVTVLWSIAPSPFVQQMFLFAFSVLRLSRLCCMFICAAFKLPMDWSNIQHVSASTTTILPTTVGTLHNLNFSSHMIYVLQTSIYQNITKLLTRLCN